jgi:hypothetical protein
MAHIAIVPEWVKLLDSETELPNALLRLVGERLGDQRTEDPGIGNTARVVIIGAVHPGRGRT